MPSLLNATVADLSWALSNERISSAALTAAYLSRIGEANGYFRAVIETNPDAQEIAKALDEEQRTKGRRGPLHGIPILLKDTVVTLDKMETTSGSTSLIGARPSQEAKIACKLRKEGAVLLGKTNMSQWGNFRTVSGGSGWSARGGLTLGAFCANMKSSGSSSGSAVGTALGLAAACIGAETDGSIISPASRAGVVGFKPTLGLISTEGMVPLAVQQDVPGPITRTVIDAAYLMDALIEDQPSNGQKPYSMSFTDTDLHNLRIGVPSSSLPESDDVPMAAFRSALELLTSAGATILLDCNFAGLEEFKNQDKKNQLSVFASYFQSNIKDYFASLTTNPNNLRNLSDVIRLTKVDPTEEYPERGIDLLEMSNSIDTEDPALQEALRLNAYLSDEGGIPGAMRNHNLDVIVAPAMYGPSVSFAARAGLPAVVVPLGKYPDGTEVKYAKSGPDDLVDIAPNIPFGIVFIGAPHSERTLFRVSYAFEQLTNVRNYLTPFNPPNCDLQDGSGLLGRPQDSKA